MAGERKARALGGRPAPLPPPGPRCRRSRTSHQAARHLRSFQLKQKCLIFIRIVPYFLILTPLGFRCRFRICCPCDSECENWLCCQHIVVPIWGFDRGPPCAVWPHRSPKPEPPPDGKVAKVGKTRKLWLPAHAPPDFLHFFLAENARCLFSEYEPTSQSTFGL